MCTNESFINIKSGHPLGILIVFIFLNGALAQKKKTTITIIKILIIIKTYFIVNLKFSTAFSMPDFFLGTLLYLINLSCPVSVNREFDFTTI